MSRIYEVTISLKDEKPDSGTPSINARFVVAESEADIGLVDILGEAFAAAVAEIRRVDAEGPDDGSI